MKRRTHTRRTLQRSDSTNVGLTNVGLLQTSDWYKRRTNKRRTATNVGLVQSSDWDKRQTSTNVGPVQTSNGYIYKKKRETLVEFEKNIPLLWEINKKSFTYCDKNHLNKVSSFEGDSTV